MPLVFGCVNGPEGAASTLRHHLSASHGDPAWTTFPGGWFAASAHGGRQATWTDAQGHAWAVLGERVMSGSGEQGPLCCGLDARGQLTLAPHARGVVAVFDRTRGALTVSCDPLNYFPAYYRHAQRSFQFGSHLWALSRFTEATPDPVGITEFLRGNWCLNGRTVFAGIRKLLPGQAVVFDIATGQLTMAETSQLWAGTAEDSTPASDEEIWGHLLEAVRLSAQADGVAGLMLSGGWDSRVMLAALKQVFGDKLVTLSHGAAGHLELELSRQLATRLKVRHLDVVLGPDSLGRSHDLDELLATSDTVLFPWWRFGSRALRDAGCNVGFTGLLGEVLGGHYTVVGRGRSRRAQEVFRRTVMRSPRQALSPAEGLRLILSQDYRQRNIPFLKREMTQAVESEVRAGIEEDKEAILQRYLRRGIGDAGRMVEAYNTEYRALDYFCQQPLTMNAQMDVSTPLGSRRLVEAILGVPLTRRIHNSMTRSLLARFQPELLEVPMAASPFVPASSPILVQEGGRVVRWLVDRVSKRVYLLSSGRFGTMRRYGWMDFEGDVRTGNYLDAWRDSLTWEGLDRGAIDRYVTGVKTHQSKVGLGRPILKLAYLDRLFRP